MIMRNKSNISLATEIIKTEITALTRTLKRIDSSFDKACELIEKTSGKVVTIGLGKSGYIAMKMAATLSSTGTPSIFIHATEALHGDMGVINSNDVIIFYSNSGNTEEIVKLVPLLKVLKCKIISITGNKKSQLAKYSDSILDASVTKEACPNNLAPTSSVICALAMSDALALTVSSKKNFTMKDFAKTHPEGALGRRLLKNVQDIMIKKNIPMLNIDASFSKLINMTTKYNLGIALIINNEKKLLGVITDGDIKRIMNSHENTEDILIKKVMTRKPLHVNSDILAAEALSVLEKNNISVLPVLDKSVIKGIITMQDLIKSIN
jgi:arabinose-5-phosphate isomerase